MNTTYKNRLNQVYTLLENDDIDLGYRTLMDCVMDTQNMSHYKSMIAITDWKSSSNYNAKNFKQKCFALLETIANENVLPNQNNQPIIEAQNITKQYRNNGFILGPISLNIKKGEVFGLVGENGNGKTTLLRILAKELTYNVGQITYNLEHNYSSNYNLKTALVYIPQRTQKWYGSLMDNLKFALSNHNCPPEENETRVLMMIARFGLWNYKHLKWSELSSGYKMRFELARTLLRQPELLLLDEPLANLDVLAQQLILEDLKSICNSINNPIALILSSQQLYEVEKISDKVIFLKQGRYNDNTSLFNTENQNLVVEIETNCSKADLQNAFKNLQLKQLVYNGGIYVAQFSNATNFTSVLLALGNANIPVVYVRNITKSTRRFFVP